MAMMMRLVLLLATIASPVIGLVAQSKVYVKSDGLENAVRQRLYAMMRSRVHDTVNSPLMMMRSRHGHDEEKATQIAAEELEHVAGLCGEALGRAASLSEDGYQAVATSQSRAAMQAYVMRVLDQEGLVMIKPDHLQGVLSYYDGECATQSFENLIKELRDGTTQQGCQEAWTARKDGVALVQEHAQTREVRSHWNEATSEGAFAPLNEEGYQAVAAKHDNQEMATFIERVMRRDGLKVNDTDGLAGFIPYYSGECATQSFEALVADIHCVGPAAVTANVTYQFSARDAPSVEQLRKSIADAAGVDEKLIVISDFVEASVVPEQHPLDSTNLPRPQEVLVKKASDEKTSKTIKMAITTEDATVLSNIRKAMKDITEIQAHLDAFDADVDIKVKPDFDVVSVTPSSCGGGWVTSV